jgi:hypothetical protein
VSVAEGLAFLREARKDEALGREIEALREDVTWESLVETAARAGFACTIAELERAHALDWSLRWARYRGSR